MTVAERSMRRLQMGRVVVQTFQAIGDNIFLFSALSIITAVPSLLVRYQQSILSDDELYSASYLLALVAFIIGLYLFTAAIAAGIVRSRAGRSPSLKDCFAEIARDFYALTAIAIVSTFVFVTAIMASPAYPIILVLLIPGFYIQVVLAVVVPVRTIERPAFLATFARSFELTRGQHWPIFGVIVAWTVLAMALEVLVYAAIGNPTSAGFTSSGRAALLSLVMVDVINGMITAATATAFYFELRLIKEGVEPEALASVFD